MQPRQLRAEPIGIYWHTLLIYLIGDVGDLLDDLFVFRAISHVVGRCGAVAQVAVSHLHFVWPFSLSPIPPTRMLPAAMNRRPERSSNCDKINIAYKSSFHTT